MTSLSNRASTLIANPSPIVTGHMKCLENPFSIENHTGHLNFGIAQNHLMENETVNFIENNHYFQKSDIQYNAGFGKQSLREAFANFSNIFLNIKGMHPDNITVQTGVSSLCESLAYCLFDEGDTILMPAPYYSGFIYDFSRRFKVNIETVDLDSKNNFKHNVNDFINRIEETTPKAVLITHPYNPTGESLSKDFYEPIIKICEEKNIHIISDEIYALSRLDGTKHESLLNYDYENIHFLYGLAKDFTLAGLKMGFFYSRNLELSTAMQTVSYFHTTSTQTQNTVELLLRDNEYITSFVKMNQTRIKTTYDKLVSNLPELKHTKPSAGIFFLADFRFLLKEDSLKGEEELFNYFINDLKINMTPGSAMGAKEFGFFRVCYAKEDSHIEEFIKRLKPLYK